MGWSPELSRADNARLRIHGRSWKNGETQFRRTVLRSKGRRSMQTAEISTIRAAFGPNPMSPDRQGPIRRRSKPLGPDRHTRRICWHLPDAARIERAAGHSRGTDAGDEREGDSWVKARTTAVIVRRRGAVLDRMRDRDPEWSKRDGHIQRAERRQYANSRDRSLEHCYQLELNEQRGSVTRITRMRARPCAESQSGCPSRQRDLRLSLLFRLIFANNAAWPSHAGNAKCMTSSPGSSPSTATHHRLKKLDMG